MSGIFGEFNAGDLQEILSGSYSKKFANHLDELYTGVKRSTKTHLEDDLIKAGYKWNSDAYGPGKTKWREFWKHKRSNSQIILEWSLHETSDKTYTPDRLLGVYGIE